MQGMWCRWGVSLGQCANQMGVCASALKCRSTVTSFEAPNASSGLSDLLGTLKSWKCEKHWARNLHRLVFRFEMTLSLAMVTLSLPVKWKNESVMMPWPTLPFSSWVKCMFVKTKGQPILAGHTLSATDAWKTQHLDFWLRYRAAFGSEHGVFQTHAERLEYCVPIMIHGDEGRGKLRRAVMCTSVQPVLRPLDKAHSFCSRYLHAILPGELYEGDITLDILHDSLVQDLCDLYHDGILVACLDVFSFVLHSKLLHAINIATCLHVGRWHQVNGSIKLYFILIGVKGDWVYLSPLADKQHLVILHLHAFHEAASM